MTREELMQDSEEFRNKEGFGYVHAELKDSRECALFINGHAPAVEALAFELITKLAENHGMPIPIYLALMLAKHDGMQKEITEEFNDGDDTLEIE